MPTRSFRLITFAALALVLPLTAQDTKVVKATQPKLISKVQPQYSEQARTDKVQGVVTLSLIVDTDGHPSNIRVAKSLGHGLDENAIDAVQKWVFQPGTMNGKPVAVVATIQVPFELK